MLKRCCFFSTILSVGDGFKFVYYDIGKIYEKYFGDYATAKKWYEDSVTKDCEMCKEELKAKLY